MVLQLQLSWANACQRVKWTDRQLKSDTVIYNTGFTNAHIKLPLHRLATVEAEDQTGPPAKHQHIDDADTEPCLLSVIDTCLSQFLTSAEPSASKQNSVEVEIDRFVSITPVDRSKFPTVTTTTYIPTSHALPNATCALR